MKILLNGETKEVPNALSLPEMLLLFSLPKRGIAVELNKQVVRKKDWVSIELKNNDLIEVIHFVGGG